MPAVRILLPPRHERRIDPEGIPQPPLAEPDGRLFDVDPICAAQQFLIQLPIRSDRGSGVSKPLQFRKDSLDQFLEDYILIDKVGYEGLTEEQANLLFWVVNTRYEHGSMIITKNKPIGQWAKILDDEKLTTAILDRLAHHSHMLATKGKSYRTLKQKGDESASQ